MQIIDLKINTLTAVRSLMIDEISFLESNS